MEPWNIQNCCLRKVRDFAAPKALSFVYLPLIALHRSGLTLSKRPIFCVGGMAHIQKSAFGTRPIIYGFTNHANFKYKNSMFVLKVIIHSSILRICKMRKKVEVNGDYPAFLKQLTKEKCSKSRSWIMILRNVGVCAYIITRVKTRPWDDALCVWNGNEYSCKTIQPSVFKWKISTVIPNSENSSDWDERCLG